MFTQLFVTVLLVSMPVGYILYLAVHGHYAKIVVPVLLLVLFVIAGLIFCIATGIAIQFSRFTGVQMLIDSMGIGAAIAIAFIIGAATGATLSHVIHSLK